MTQQPKQKASGSRMSFMSVFSAQNRIAIAIGLAIICMAVAVWYGINQYTTKASEVKVQTSKVNAANIKPDADAQPSQAYKDAKRQQNESKYEAAEKTANGVAVPFVFPEDHAAEEKPIDTCNCKISDEQLIEAIKRVNGGSDSSPSVKRIAKSDIYLNDKNNLSGENGAPLQLKNSKVSMDQSGAIITENGMPAITTKGETLYMSKTGEILNSAAQKAFLGGDLLSSTGEVYLPTGLIATDKDSKQRYGSSDIYITTEGQLVTVDARPITSGGMFAYADAEGLIKNRAQTVIEWENKRAYVSKTGQLEDQTGTKFKNPGLLFTYNGVIIDNDGMLTKPLESVQKMGESDIYYKEDGTLVDENSKPLLNYGQKVKKTTDGFIKQEGGGYVNTVAGNGITLNRDGTMTTDGKGIAQSGILRDSQGVAINKNGQLITRSGYIEKMGGSDIHVTPDGLLSDAKGRPVVANNGDVFLSNQKTNSNGDLLAVKLDGSPIKTKSQIVVYVSKAGELFDESGKPITDTGVFSTYDGVAFDQSGRLLIRDDGLTQLYTTAGVAVKYEGRDVFISENGQIFDEANRPIMSDDGKSMFVDDSGNLVDEFGKTLVSTKLTANGVQVKPGELQPKLSKSIKQVGKSDIFVTKDGLLVDSRGRLLTSNNKRVTASTSSGQIYDDTNQPVMDRFGSPLTLMPDGTIVNSSKVKTNDDPLATWDKMLVSPSGKILNKALDRVGISEIYLTPEGSLTDETGRYITYGGARVYLDADRKLLAYRSIQVVNKSGLQVFLNNAGQLQGKSGQSDKSTILLNHEGVLFDWDGFLITNGNRLERVEGTDLFATVDQRLVSKAGIPVRRKGVDLYISKDRMIASQADKPVQIKKGSAYFSKAGNLIDKNGQPILDDESIAIYLSPNGELIHEDGSIAVLNESAEDAKPSGFTDLIDPSKSAEQFPPPAAAPGPQPNPANEQKLLELDEKAAERLRARYSLMKNSMRDQLIAASASANRRVEPSLVSVKGEANSGLDEELEGIAGGTGSSCVGEGCKKTAKAPPKLLKKAGTMLFAVTEHKINSDFSKQAMVRVVGLPQNDPLYGAKLIGAFELKYDHLVLTFNSVALPNGGTATMQGVAIDSQNSDMGLQGEVNNHYWYRFGGLFVASLLQGAAEAAEKTGTTNQTNNAGGNTTQITGIKGSDVVTASFGKTGEAFTKVFADNVTRPVTVEVGVGQEMGVILFQDIVETPKQYEIQPGSLNPASAAGLLSAPAASTKP